MPSGSPHPGLAPVQPREQQVINSSPGWGVVTQGGTRAVGHCDLWLLFPLYFLGCSSSLATPSGLSGWAIPREPFSVLAGCSPS